MSSVAHGARYRTDDEVKEAVRRLLAVHLLEINDVAELLDVDLEDAEAMVNGDDYLTGSDLARLAAAFGVEVDELVYTPFDSGLFRSSATPQDNAEAMRIVCSYAKAFRLLDAATGK
jgi:plasmid maintenance system antidote protein VapI